jgi:hypothetical protein
LLGSISNRYFWNHKLHPVFVVQAVECFSVEFDRLISRKTTFTVVEKNFEPKTILIVITER